MFDSAGIAERPCSYGATSGVPCPREHVTSLAQYADLKKFRQLIAQVEVITKETKGIKVQQLGGRLVNNLKARIVPSTAKGVAKGTMMVNTK
jgi:hypothetical protein